MAERVAKLTPFQTTIASLSALVAVVVPPIVQYNGWTKPAQEARIANVDRAREAQSARLANVDELRRAIARADKYEKKWEACVEECHEP